MNILAALLILLGIAFGNQNDITIGDPEASKITIGDPESGRITIGDPEAGRPIFNDPKTFNVFNK